MGGGEVVLLPDAVRRNVDLFLHVLGQETQEVFAGEVVLGLLLLVV